MILVFGGGGFIGTYLIDSLFSSGFSPVLSDIPPIQMGYYTKRGIPCVQLDIRDRYAFGFLSEYAYSIDAVVNLACLQPVNVSDKYMDVDYIYTNVIGTLNILDFCVKNNIKKYIGTVSHRGVQGLWEKGEVITEEHKKCLGYDNEYSMFSISECSAIDCIEYYAHKYGMQNIILRLPPVYGYGPHLSGFCEKKPLKSGFMTFIEKARNNEPLELWGDVDRSRDIIYVKDVVSAILLSIQNRKARGIYNISSGKKVSLKEEAEEIIKVFSSEVNSSEVILRSDRPNSVEQFSYNIDKAKKDLQWTPKYTLYTMLVDIKKEMESSRFSFLVDKREELFTKANN